MDEELGTRLVLGVVMIVAGLLLIWMARAAATGRLRRNRFAGLRIPSTMASDEAWLAAHIRAQGLIIAAGIVSLVYGLSAFLPVSIMVVTLGALVACLVMLGLMVYATVVGGQVAKLVAEDATR